MVKVKIDRGLCIACGSCYAVCPDVYEGDEEGKSKIIDEYLKAQTDEASVGEIGADKEGCAKEGAETCPVDAIEID